MYKANIFHGHWLERKKLWFNRPVSIYHRAVQPEDDDGINILNLCGEPKQSRGAPNKKIFDIGKHYNLIVSWDDEILNTCDNVKFMPFGTTWINKKNWRLKPKPKKFKVTTLCGGKKNTTNHLKRFDLWKKQKKIEMPNVFWNSSHNKLPDKNNNPILDGQPTNKIKMMDAQFHIAIENICEKNYFSEKLIDCLVTGTIPIYCGCTNLGDYFDTRGIIQVQTVSDIIKTCNSLKASLYKEWKEYIEINYHLALEYANSFSSRLHAIINEYLRDLPKPKALCPEGVSSK